MRIHLVFYCLICLYACTDLSPKKEPQSNLIVEHNKMVSHLELLHLKQLIQADSNWIELSGLFQYERDLLAISDREDQPYILRIKEQEDRWETVDTLKKLQTKNFSAEAICLCDHFAYVANENSNKIYKTNLESTDQTESLITIPIEFVDSDNAGIEGISMDCRNNVLYLSKEHSPSIVFQYDLGKKTLKQLQIEGLSAYSDISDLFYDHSSKYLYVLERRFQQISKIDLFTLKVIDVRSFSKVTNLNGIKLYDQSKEAKTMHYGLAEALYMNEASIFIGIDNNQYPVTRQAELNFGLVSKHASIIEFRRPDNF